MSFVTIATVGVLIVIGAVAAAYAVVAALYWWETRSSSLGRARIVASAGDVVHVERYPARVRYTRT